MSAERGKTKPLLVELHGDTVQNGTYTILNCTSELPLSLIEAGVISPSKVNAEFLKGYKDPSKTLIVDFVKKRNRGVESVCSESESSNGLVIIKSKGERETESAMSAVTMLQSLGYFLEKLTITDMKQDWDAIKHDITISYERSERTMIIDIGGLPSKKQRQKLSDFLRKHKYASY